MTDQLTLPFDAGMAGSALASDHRWTPLEAMAVDRAIERVADRQALFTADDVWKILGPDFPVTKGMGARLNAARRRGVIAPTGQVTHSQRTGDHGHAQRLAIWRPVP